MGTISPVVEAMRVRGSLRELNRARVVDTLRDAGVTSRAELARRTGLSRSTVSAIIAELAREGVVVDHDADDAHATRPPQGGRPPALISLGRPAGVAVGIDFGKRHLSVILADASHEALAERRLEMPEDYAAAEGFDAAAGLALELLAEEGMALDLVLGVGLGIPGPIHRRTGTIGSTAILPGWVGVDVASEMEGRLGVRVQVENDANLGALAEAVWGAGRGCEVMVYLKLATGIGAGIVVAGRLFHGTGGTAGEIGHITLDEHGELCRCGNRGCLETLAAAPAITGLLRRAFEQDVDTDEVVTRARAGDPACSRALGDAGRHVGIAVASLCNLMNPERIVVGGSIGAAGEVLLEPLRDSVRRRAIPSASQDVEIVSASLGERAELLGAVALVFQGAGAAAVHTQSSLVP